MVMFTVVFLSFLVVFSLVNGTPQFTNCPSSVCLSQSVPYQCSGANSLQLRVLDTNDSQIGIVPFIQGQAPTVSPIGTGSGFTATLIDSSGPIVANVTFTPLFNISNYTVECGSISFTPVTCPIVIAGIPSAPVLNDPNFTSDALTFSWSPSTSPCVSHYNVNVTSIEYTINTTDTSLSLPVPSTNDTEYSISIVAVDTGGRYTDPEERTFVADVPDSVINLTLSQTDFSIDVSWDEPFTPVYLPVLNYVLYHDVSDSRTPIPVPTPTTTYNIPDATVGSAYTVGVAAVNVLGAGPIASATISIISTSVSSTITSVSMTVTPSVSNSPPVTSMSEATQSTSTPTLSPTSSEREADNTLYIAVGASIGGVVAFVILIIIIIVGYLVWRKSKGEKANFDQRRDSTEPIALVDKKDHGSSPATGQPIYQEAMSSEDIQREAAPTTGELYAQPSKGSTRRPPPQPQSELATYQDPSTIQRTQAPNMEYLYAEVDKSKPQQQQAVYAQVDKDKKGGDGTVYADLELKNTQGGPVTGSNPSNVIYSDVHNN